MRAKLIKRSGLSAIVVYRDGRGLPNAVIIDSKDLPSYRAGEEMEINDNVIATSTPYGVDWTVVFPEGIVIQPEDIQEVLYSNGIISMTDVRQNTVSLITAVNSLIRMTSAKILSKVKETMEEQNDKL